MKLTDRARRDLERYLGEIRDSLANEKGIDPDDVVEGVREHVEAALTRSGVDPVTAEDLADVLDRLGSPDQWGHQGGRGPSGPLEETAGEAADPESPGPSGGPWVELAPLILTGAGGVLVLVELTVPLGWALLGVGAVTARLVVGTPGHRARGPSGVSATLVAILWHVAAAVLVGAILLLPAVLVWSQSQIGGALEPFLIEHTLPPGVSAPPIPGNRPPGFWPLVGLLGGVATGTWWLGLGLAGRAVGDGFRRALGPASYLASGPILGSLAVTGGFLLVLSSILLVGALG